MKYIEKNVLDLKYKNLLNWRSIVFGFYFAILALGGSYLFRIYNELTSIIIFLIVLGVFSWRLLDEWKYSEIKQGLENIENQIRSLK